MAGFGRMSCTERRTPCVEFRLLQEIKVSKYGTTTLQAVSED